MEWNLNLEALRITVVNKKIIKYKNNQRSTEKAFRDEDWNTIRRSSDHTSFLIKKLSHREKNSLINCNQLDVGAHIKLSLYLTEYV